MGDSPAKNGYKGWRGRLPVPAPRAGRPLREWVDLTYPLSPDVARVGL